MPPVLLRPCPRSQGLCSKLAWTPLAAASLLREGLALNLLQWNPHWECFEQSKNHCQEEFAKNLAIQLREADIDFANVVEYTDKHRKIPEKWGIVDNVCGLDRTTLLYNQERWSLPTDTVASRKGCMAVNDRPFIVQQFVEANAYGGRRKVTVIGAHYPHSKDRTTLSSALKAVVTETGVDSVVLLADTNEDRGVPSEKLWNDINGPPGHMLSTELHATCCLNRGFKDHMMAYDRIITNIGTHLNTNIPLSEAPPWAQGEFHKPIAATIIEPTKTSTTSTSTLSTTSTTTTTSSTITHTTTTTLTRTITSTSTTTTTTTPALVIIFVGIGVTSTCSVVMLMMICVLLMRRYSQAPAEKSAGVLVPTNRRPAGILVPREDSGGGRGARSQGAGGLCEVRQGARTMVVDDEAAVYRLEQDDCIDSDCHRTHSDIDEDVAEDHVDEPCKADQALLPDSRGQDGKKTHSWRRLLKPTGKRR